MTKYLVKIISICTFVVLIPVIIAGVALSAIGSTLFNLDVFVAVNKDNSAANYKIFLGEKDGDKLEQAKATYLNGTEVNVNLDLVGYDFVGWFKGDDKTYDAESEPLSSESNYTFELKHNTQITALLKVKEYNLTFENIDEGVVINQDAELTAQDIAGTYEYEASLPKLSIQGSKIKFLGWRNADPAANPEPTTTANFATSGDYTLVPAWSNRMQVVYYTKIGNEWKSFYNDFVTDTELASFQFLAQDEEHVANAIGKGYAFANWVDQAGANLTVEQVRTTEFVEDGEISIYLQKTPIQYTINVSKFATESENAPMTYDVEKGFGKTTLSRPYYTLIGLTYDGKDYVWNESTSDYEHTEAGKVTTLSSVILDATNADHTFNAVAIWEAEFKTLKIEFTVVYTDFEENAYDVFGKNAQGHKLLNELNNTVSYNVDDKDGIKLEDSIFATFTGNEFDSYFIMKDDVQTEVVFKTGRAYFPENIHGSTKREFNESATFADIIKVLSGYDVNVATEEIAIEFVFKEAAK